MDSPLYPTFQYPNHTPNFVSDAQCGDGRDKQLELLK